MSFTKRSKVNHYINILSFEFHKCFHGFYSNKSVFDLLVISMECETQKKNCLYMVEVMYMYSSHDITQECMHAYIQFKYFIERKSEKCQMELYGK